MELKNMKCSVCGGVLKEKSGMYVCEYCDSTFRVQTSESEYDRILGYLELSKQEALSSARYNLYDSTHREYLSKEKIRSCVSDVKRLYPEDFMASFYECLMDDDKNVLNEFLNSIDIDKTIDYKDEIIKGTIKSLDYANVISLKNYVDRACSLDDKTRYNTEIETLALKMNEGIYSLDIDRDFFICYSSKDMKKVVEIVDYLESNGLTCFVALRNLRHGIGSVENYKESIKKAMRNSKGLIFLSSNNSRDMGCDALKLELPYLKNDLKNKSRIEYLLDEYSSKTSPFAKAFLKQVFDGLEWCRTLDDLTLRASSIIFGLTDDEPKEETKKVKIKYCVSCGTENDLDTKFCRNCGSNEFADNVQELIKKQNEKREVELKKREEEIRKEAERKFNLEKEKTESKNVGSSTSLNTVSNKNQTAKTTTNKETPSTYKKISDKEIYFGRYPQTLVDGSMIKELSDIRFDIKTWKDYGYYKDGKKTSYMYYLDVDTNNDGMYDYRGVYFVEYRPKKTSDPLTVKESVQEINKYVVNTLYWFRYDPIKWQVLRKYENKAMIVSQMIVDSQNYHNALDNNYKNSQIRTWLNDVFYKTAFRNDEKNNVLITNVDNSISTTGYNGNKYACENTFDKMFILSYYEAWKIMPNKSNRLSQPTDYAKVQGACFKSSTGYGYWWLRSPNANRISVSSRVYEDGILGFGEEVTQIDGGIRPACWINLDPSLSKTQVEKKTESKTITSNDSSSIVSKSNQAAETTTDKKTLSTYKKISDKEILFGRYPQTLVDGSKIRELSDITFDKKTWKDYKYYKNGKISGFMFYKDIDTNGDGTYDYRGVYFTKYRPFFTFASSSKSNSYQGGNGYNTNTIYWFRYDSVKWDILRTKNEKTLIITNLLVDSQQYCAANSTKSSFIHNGEMGYPNDYALSDIRKWLNDAFYDTVFNELEKSIIFTTAVDNSVSSTGFSNNQYACKDTNDRVFLLSYEEVTSLYSSENARIARLTDYAKCQGAEIYKRYDSGYWWLRSPHYNESNYAECVSFGGNLYVDHQNDVDCTDNGVRPACWIKLND